jgi:cytochrome P450
LITDELVDALPDSGETDLVEFAHALPMRVICELLGVPAEIHGQMQTWGVAISGAPHPDAESNARLKWASESIEQFFIAHINAKRAKCRPDWTQDPLCGAAEPIREFHPGWGP